MNEDLKYKVLNYVYEQGDTAVSSEEIENIVSIDNDTVQRLFVNLKLNGYINPVAENEEDGYIEILITAKGRKYVEDQKKNNFTMIVKGLPLRIFKLINSHKSNAVRIGLLKSKLLGVCSSDELDSSLNFL